ncbi:hypothetical protein F4560_007342 [Saccharothrix ecbatanensis]|uniref:DUF6968 domain-containing protein n=1 Tax=Saccharothrix ecbatanensis TaxID=1105145 RepID=A0A7W9HSE1_9PSEU|nr:hypothetical protein [Saccharothrix ecbatanensis]MBB5807574.1 hypothetical protein [Saccharothrix ecbatanensis]
MTAYRLGEVVAERRLECVAGDGARTPVVIRFGRPHPDPLSTNGDWCCPHQIVGLGDETVGASFGVDSLQALLLSVYRVRLKLADRATAASVDLDWLGLPDLGLTVTPTTTRPTNPPTQAPGANDHAGPDQHHPA